MGYHQVGPFGCCSGILAEQVDAQNVKFYLSSHIPKCDGADRLSQFHPISLCNFIYKVISKLIADRLKKGHKELISEEQSGFVAGRQILDGIVIATETIHSMASSKEKGMFIKLHMAKAYDRVRWSFL